MSALEADFYSSTVLSRRKCVTVLLGTTSVVTQPHVAKIYNIREIRAQGAMQFVNEPTVLQYLRHSRLLECYGCRINSNRDTVTVFEEFGQVSLLKLINEHRKTGRCFSESAIWSLAAGILSFLEFLHCGDNKTFYNSVSNASIRIGSMIHGNLRPSNIYIVHQQNMSSFGIADVKVTHPAIYRNFAQTSTGRSMQMDDLLYFPPEVLNTLTTSFLTRPFAQQQGTGGLDPAQDVWALGIILYEMVSLAGSHGAHGIDKVALSRLSDPSLHMRERGLGLDSTYSPELVDFIFQMLQPDPQQRPQVHALLFNNTIISVLRGSSPPSPAKQREPAYSPKEHILHRDIPERSQPAAIVRHNSNGRPRECTIEDIGISNLSDIECRVLNHVDAQTSPTKPMDMDLEEVIEMLNKTRKSSNKQSADEHASKRYTTPRNRTTEAPVFTKTAVHLLENRARPSDGAANSSSTGVNRLALRPNSESSSIYSSYSDSSRRSSEHAKDSRSSPSREKSNLETPSIMQNVELRDSPDYNLRSIKPAIGPASKPLETISENCPVDRSVTTYTRTPTHTAMRPPEAIKSRASSAYYRKSLAAQPFRAILRSEELVPLLISNDPSNGTVSKYSYRKPTDPMVYKQIYVRSTLPANRPAAEGMHPELSHTIFGLSPNNYVSFDAGRLSSNKRSNMSGQASGSHGPDHEKGDTLRDSNRSQSGVACRSVSQARDGISASRQANRKLLSWRSKEEAIANAHVVKRDKRGNTQLMLMALSNNVKGVQEYLYQAGLQNKSGYTAMMIAAKRGFIDIVKLLMNQEAGITTKRKCSTPSVTALILAAMAGQAEVVYLLHEKEKGIQDKNGMTALMHAAIRGYTDIVLILHSAEARKRDFQGCTALLLATECNRLDIVKILAERETKLSTTDGYKYGSGFTALMCAARLGFTQAVEILVKDEANMMHVPIDRESGGCTALVWAAREGHLTCVKELAPYEAASSGTLAITEGEKSLTNSKAKKQKIRQLIKRHIVSSVVSTSGTNRASSKMLRTCDI